MRMRCRGITMRNGLVRARLMGSIAALAALSLSSAVMAGQCQQRKIGELPIEMSGSLPIVSTKINGTAVRFFLSAGSAYSMIWSDAARRYQLPITKGYIATVNTFEFLGVPFSNVQFTIRNSSADDPAGFIGQNVLQISDEEYDLANGVVRFFKPLGCDQQPLAYWATTIPYTSVPLQSKFEGFLTLVATSVVNGRDITAWLSTGSPRSYLSLDAAARIGITPTSPGVTYVATTGLGKVWSAPVDSFQLGGEKVGHTHLLFVEYARMPYDMVLGNDFFLSHRIYVAYGQNKLYFTYNGGPLFNLDLPQVLAGKETPPATLDLSAHAASTTGGQAEPGAPNDADGFRREGMAYAAMREFDRALADLTRACGIAPTDAENYYDRGTIYWQAEQFKAALDDFSTAIRLQPGDMDAHLARAQLLRLHPDANPAATSADIETDLAAASRLAAPDAAVRLSLYFEYQEIRDYSAALSQINQWLDKHPVKNDQALGLNDRCWLRASANRDLREALDDCNHALDLASNGMDILDSRGLVNLRLGNDEAAESDYNMSLDLNPQMATSLYGRGLARLRMGERSLAQGDLAAAAKLDSGIAKRFEKMGLVPAGLPASSEPSSSTNAKNQ